MDESVVKDFMALKRLHLDQLNLPGANRRQRRFMRRFVRDEEGSLIVFTLFLFVLMLMMGGMAVDIMRAETMRTDIQQTLDRGTLAAANMQHKLDPESVVRDYFDKAGLSQYLSNVTVLQGLSFRTVTASALAETNPIFLHMVGIDSLPVSAASTAEQKISNVEVSMVLDISGSMTGSRITNLKPAARSFIDTVIKSSDPGHATISIVPYNSQVNLGEPLMSQFNVTAKHSNSYCIELPDSDFNSISLSQTTSFEHNEHFDASQSGPAPSWFNCPPQAGNTVTPLGDDVEYLQGRIDALESGGYTSIDVGMKWGTLLLDPAAKPVVNGLINRGVVDASYEGRPQGDADQPALKVIVLMTDGDNTNEWKLNPAYAEGLSTIYRGNTNGRLSIYRNVSGSNDYYWMSDRSWHNEPEGGFSGSTQMLWRAVWDSYTVRYIASNLYSKAYSGSSSDWEKNFTDVVSSIKNTRLQQICTAAKNAGFTVFTIAFEAPSDGQTQLRNCASDPKADHYFNAKGLQISSVFNAIATQLSELRLTQ